MITPAFAQTTGAGGGDILGLFFPLILVFGIFYLLVFRPQQKRMKEHQAMIDAVKRGDTVVTSGESSERSCASPKASLGSKSPRGCRFALVKGSITEVRGKGEPVKGEKPTAPGKPGASEDESGKQSAA